jgi:hypothetical protein
MTMKHIGFSITLASRRVSHRDRLRNIVLLLSIIILPAGLFAQETGQNTNVSQAFEMDNPKEEIARLESKKANITYRLEVLNQNAVTNADEIARLNGMINYINAKIESLQKVILSEEYAEKTGAPEKNGMTDEQYKQAKLEWKDSISASTQNMPIKTTLTRYEFEKLPKDRQEKILSMPERYTIID